MRQNYFKILRRIVYSIAALSLVPIATTNIGYAQTKHMYHLLFFIGAIFGLINMTFKPTKIRIRYTFVFSLVSNIIIDTHVIFLWFEDVGGDPNMLVLFTIQSILLFLTLVFLIVEMKELKKHITK